MLGWQFRVVPLSLLVFVCVLIAKVSGSVNSAWPLVFLPLLLVDAVAIVLGFVSPLSKSRVELANTGLFVLKLVFELLLSLRLEGSISWSFGSVTVPLLLALVLMLAAQLRYLYLAANEGEHRQ